MTALANLEAEAQPSPVQAPLRDVAIDAAASEEVLATCRAILKTHARSFSWAALFLTPRLRDDAAVAYAFCRLVDDAVDEAPSQEIAQQALETITDMLTLRRSPDGIVAAYRELCERTGIGLMPALELIKGAKSDLQQVQMKDVDELLLYAYRVAGTVGQMMCGILGVQDERAERHAIALGVAMQLTNICRDVKEDGRRGRVYLPESRLRHFGATSSDVLGLSTGVTEEPLSAQAIQAISETVAEVLCLSERYYQDARSGYRYIPVRPRLAIVVAAALYREIGVVVTEGGHDISRGRACVSLSRKLCLSAASAMRWLLGMFQGPEPALLEVPPVRLLR